MFPTKEILNTVVLVDVYSLQYPPHPGHQGAAEEVLGADAQVLVHTLLPGIPYTHQQLPKLISSQPPCSPGHHSHTSLCVVYRPT